ncbi:MAG: hypothetical protein RI903_778 [Bacteroidota bacterium]
MHVLITGGTGLIGQALRQKLLAEGHRVSILSRSGGDYTWDVAKAYFQPEALDGVDAVVHLAGAGIADKRWTEARKRELIGSRVDSSALLIHALKTIPNNVKVVLSASAIGFYGADSGEVRCEETSPAGTDFLATCTQAWEASISGVEVLGIRLVKFRIGLVLSAKGGIFPVLCRPIRYLVGAVLGHGKQWQSWIHVDDLVGMFRLGLADESLKGVFNAVSPGAIRHREMTQKIARAMHKPLLLPPIPGFLLRLALGEMACLVLGGNLVSADKIQKEGKFTFTYTRLEDALKELLHG